MTAAGPCDRTLGEQERAVLAERASWGVRALRAAPVAESRAAQWLSRRQMPAPAPVAAVHHRHILTPTAEVAVRVYIPHGIGPFPALVQYHGGCWIIGNIDLSDRPHRALAAVTGCIVVAVNYQTAPEHRFPIPLDDCYAGLRWTREHAAEYGIDPSRIGVCGDSAGGNLAAAVALRARALGDPPPAAQVLIYPALDPALDTASARDCARGYGLTTADMAWTWTQYATSEQLNDPLVAPARAVTLAGLPPAVVVTAGFDVLRDEGRAYAHRLVADGVPTTELHYPKTVHGFFEIGGALDAGPRMLADLAEALPRLWGACSTGAPDGGLSPSPR